MPSKKQPGSNPLSGQSPPTPTIGETTLNGLPVLTEIVAEGGTHLSGVLNAEDIQRLWPQLEAHIETLFTRKLGLQLEQLQRQAIERALIELKAELPELLRDTLNAYLNSR